MQLLTLRQLAAASFKPPRRRTLATLAAATFATATTLTAANPTAINPAAAATAAATFTAFTLAFTLATAASARWE